MARRLCRVLYGRIFKIFTILNGGSLLYGDGNKPTSAMTRRKETLGLAMSIDTNT